MRLKRLELFGFKSFADRTVLDFPRELTGIVGPNGCGKSNVVDAVRWVLGETRPTSMRGGEMSDVIFKGSTSRPALGVAEVTLVLDNGGGAIPTHGAEVAVTRRVFRSGDGEYEIDGARVRLKDVKDLLFDTGLGSRGYSVLEQGRIDAVLSANPKDRRAIFEEAAGVSRFRQRRKETENRLARADQDVERLVDVIKELESRVRSLKIQAGKAERYVELQGMWQERATRHARHQLVNLETQLETLRATRAGLLAELADLRAAREAGEAQTRVRGAEQAALASELERTGSRASHVAGELRAVDERRHQLGQRVEGWRAAASNEARRSEELDRRRAERESELETASREAVAAGAELERAEAEVEERAARTRELERGRRDAREGSESQQRKVLEWQHKRSEAEHLARHLAAALAPLSERAERAGGLCSERAARVDAARTEVDAAEAAHLAAETRRTEAAAARAAIEGELEGLGERAIAAAEARKTSELERARLAARIDGLLDFEGERAGLEAGARALLGEDAGFAVSLDGLLADHLHVPARLARALDVVLGDAAQALVLSAPDRALELAEWLREGRRGQARFALPSLWGAMAEDRPLLPAGLEGQAEPLVARVDADAGFAPLLRWLLAECVLVESLAQALELAPRYPGWRFVTPEGDLVDAGGLVAGWREVAHGAIGRRAEAAELEAQAERVEAELAQRVEEQLQLAGQREESARALRESGAVLERRRSEVSDAHGRRQSARVRLTEAERSLAEARVEESRVAVELERCEKELDAARERRTESEAHFARENGLLQERESARQALEQERESAQREEQRARIELTRLRERHQGLAERIAVLERGCRELASEIERSRRAAGEAAGSAELGAAQAERLGTERVGLLEERGRLDEVLGELRERERDARAAIEGLRRGLDALTARLEQQLAAEAQLELELQRTQLAAEELLRRVEEDLATTRAGLLENFECDPALVERGALDALGQEAQELRRQLDRLGPVNLEAVAELTEVSGRLQFLTAQRKDLAESRAELVQSLALINSESERLFTETFEDIRENFRGIFRQLFGGGTADIALIDGEGVLEAGIEISAQPPGRQKLPIGLLSGGQRTMTALALLFAVFQARPSPFCVLDEVDAALDDANVGRFLGMLEGFLANTQFIVVTHNKGTMVACEMLYGITMETKGVSRRVSVELDEVDGFVPQATGRMARGARAGARTAVVAGSTEDRATEAAGATPGDEPTYVLEAAPRRTSERGEDDETTDSRSDSESQTESVTSRQ